MDTKLSKYLKYSIISNNKDRFANHCDVTETHEINQPPVHSLFSCLVWFGLIHYSAFSAAKAM